MTKYISGPKKQRDFNFIELEVHNLNIVDYELGLLMENVLRETYTYTGEVDILLIKALVRKFLGDNYNIVEGKNMPKYNGCDTQQFLVATKDFKLVFAINIIKSLEISKKYDLYQSYSGMPQEHFGAL